MEYIISFISFFLKCFSTMILISPKENHGHILKQSWMLQINPIHNFFYHKYKFGLYIDKRSNGRFVKKY